MRILNSLVLILLAGMIAAQNVADKVVGPSMTFDTSHFDLGPITKGDIHTMVYQFKNTGTEDLKIEIVSGCECTTLDWPRLPIKPDSTGVVTAIFDSSEKEKSETVDIDINLENLDPKSGYPMFKRVTYSFELIE